MIKNQVLLSLKQFIYKHQADSPSVNFEIFLRYLMLIQKIEFRIAKKQRKTRSSLEEMGHIAAVQ